MLKKIICNQSILQSIISDRDKLFTFKFWNIWTRQLGTKVKLSTVYHSQTDKQTKQTNQTLEQYLKHYVNFKQNNWIDLLPLAQFTYNNQQQSATRLSPFYANFGRHSNWNPTNSTTNFASEAANTAIQDIAKLYETLSKKVTQ